MIFVSCCQTKRAVVGFTRYPMAYVFEQDQITGTIRDITEVSTGGPSGLQNAMAGDPTVVR